MVSRAPLLTAAAVYAAAMTSQVVADAVHAP
jgi:hypothetical protein